MCLLWERSVLKKATDVQERDTGLSGGSYVGTYVGSDRNEQNLKT